MPQFLHLGVPVAAPRPGMQYKEDLRVWVSDPADDPFQRELVCYEPGTPFPPGVQNRTHTAWQVDALAPVLEQADAVLFGPVERGGGLTIAFVELDGAVLELCCRDRQS